MGEPTTQIQGEQQVIQAIKKAVRCLDRTLEDLDAGFLHAAFLDLNRVVKNTQDACRFLRLADGLKEEAAVLIRE